MTPIRLVVVDDHMVFREGLRALLSRIDDIEIVGDAANTQDAVEVTEAVRPDVVLMDLNLPGDGGEVATTTILAAHPEVAVLVQTMHSDDAHLRPRCTLAPVAISSKMPSRMPSSGQSSL